MNDLISRSALLEDFEWLRMTVGTGSVSDIDDAIGRIKIAPAIDAEPVRHGRWILKVHDERVNCRWNVTAYCSECCDEEKEIWAGFFPGVPDFMAHDISLDSAKTVKLSNYCPNCGAKNVEG